MSLRDLSYKYGVAKRVIYSIISFLKILVPIFTLEKEIMKSVGFLEPFFLGVFDFLSENFNIVIFVGITTLMTGAFTYFIFPVGESFSPMMHVYLPNHAVYKERIQPHRSNSPTL